MTQDTKTALVTLKNLADIDGASALLKGQKEKLEEKLQVAQGDLERKKADAEVKRHAHTEKNERYQKEEKRIKYEQDKLVDRRKALQALTNYKLQQAAAKEIEAAARTLGSQEEKLILMLEDIDVLNESAEAAEKSLEETTAAYEKFAAEFEDEVGGILDRLKENDSSRKEFVEALSAAHMKAYDKLHLRFPTNPVVALSNNICQGCHMKLGPQAVVEVMRSSNVVFCRSCGRVLYAPEQLEG